MDTDSLIDSDYISDDDHKILDDSNYIGPFTDKLIEDFVHEFRKEKNMDRIRENVIDPVICDINERYFPHMVTLITLLILIIILLMLIVVMNFTSTNEKNSDD